MTSILVTYFKLQRQFLEKYNQFLGGTSCKATYFSITTQKRLTE